MDPARILATCGGTKRLFSSFRLKPATGAQPVSTGRQGCRQHRAVRHAGKGEVLRTHACAVESPRQVPASLRWHGGTLASQAFGARRADTCRRWRGRTLAFGRGALHEQQHGLAPRRQGAGCSASRRMKPACHHNEGGRRRVAQGELRPAQQRVQREKTTVRVSRTACGVADPAVRAPPGPAPLGRR